MIFLFRWLLRLVLALFILYSYFHSTPFPLDKPIILVCTMIYFVLDFGIMFFDNFITKNYKMFFTVTGKMNSGKVSHFKNFDNKPVKVSFKSDIP